MTLAPPPSWYARVSVNPLFHRRAIAIDTNTLVHYLEKPQADDELRFVFESSPAQLALKLSRQVINESLHPVLAYPGRRWQSVEFLVGSGKVILFGSASLPPTDRRILNELRAVLRICVSEPASAVLADSLAYRLHLFTREIKLRNAIKLALKNSQVMGFLAGHRLATLYQNIIAD